MLVNLEKINRQGFIDIVDKLSLGMDAKISYAVTELGMKNFDFVSLQKTIRLEIVKLFK